MIRNSMFMLAVTDVYLHRAVSLAGVVQTVGEMDFVKVNQHVDIWPIGTVGSSAACASRVYVCECVCAVAIVRRGTLWCSAACVLVVCVCVCVCVCVFV